TELQHAIRLSAIRTIDPDFSQIGFEDFAFRLFATAHRNRTTPEQRATLAPYVSTAARQQLSERDGGPVQSVVVGAMRVVGLVLPEPASEGDQRVRVSLEFEANVTAGVSGSMQTAFSVETWQVSRAANARSKPPKLGRQLDVLPCPNCGAPWAANATGTQTCAACGEVVDNGRFDWVVDKIFVNSIQARPPTLTANVQERGTDLATYRQPEFPTVLRQLSQDDPTVNISEIQARLAMIYERLNKAWSAGDLTPVRGLLSMSQYDSLQYWLDAYAKQDLRNQLLDMHITKLEPCKLMRDRYFDALTIRIWGTGKDFVVNRSSSRVVTGSKTKDRAYSEYWTLIRSHDAKGPAKADATCGHCGAELKIDAAGACEYCGSALASGDFDWVLSKIEQDDSYRG
ncbi:MAG: TIM44-like domain-containing protein, partial [Kofleriaceae bacterium]|nr:TIM44-like domain-containing protein [Kofleriaceae bacterium]